MKTYRILSLVIVVALLALAAHMFLKGRNQIQLHACICNLKQIVSAKGSLALENKIPNGAEITASQVALLMRGGVLPLCPAGGTYTIGLSTGDKENPGDDRHAPRCSRHGSAAYLADGNHSWELAVHSVATYRAIAAVCLLVAFHIVVTLFVVGNRERQGSASQQVAACGGPSSARP